MHDGGARGAEARTERGPCGMGAHAGSQQHGVQGAQAEGGWRGRSGGVQGALLAYARVPWLLRASARRRGWEPKHTPPSPFRRAIPCAPAGQGRCPKEAGSWGAPELQRRRQRPPPPHDTHERNRASTRRTHGPEVEVAAARARVLRKEPVEYAGRLHHAVVLAQVVLGLGQESVLAAVAAQELDLRARGGEGR